MTEYSLKPISLTVARFDQASPPSVLMDLDVVLAHCAIEQDHPLVPLILDVHLPGAVEWAEAIMHRAVVARQHTWTLEAFPYGWNQSIRLPRGKTVSVDHISYSYNGQTATLTGPSSPTPGTDYAEDLSSDSGGIVMPIRGQVWPSTDCDVPAPVQIVFTAGYNSDQIPPDIMSAILFEISSRLNIRDQADVKGGLSFNDRAASIRESLLSPYILNRTYC